MDTFVHDHVHLLSVVLLATTFVELSVWASIAENLCGRSSIRDAFWRLGFLLVATMALQGIVAVLALASVSLRLPLPEGFLPLVLTLAYATCSIVGALAAVARHDA